MSVTHAAVKTSHAELAIAQTSGKGLPVLLIHGNSSCKEVFRKQLDSELGDVYRMIAIDLPGHGESGDAVDPERSYSIVGYADVVVEALAQLGIERAAVYGWSLGGHVAIELLPRFPGVVGIMISSAPPVGRSPQEIQAGFNPSPHIGLAGKADLSPEEVEIFVRATTGEPVDEIERQAIVRTDGRARALMFASLFAGEASDERELAVNASVPVAIVNGADDPLVNIDYVSGLPYRNLWDSHCYALRGGGHAPFLRAPEAFNKILSQFLADMAKRSAQPRAGKASGTAAA